MKRKTIPQKVRFDVFKRDGFKCQYCGESAPDVVLHVDHIIPVSKGGTNELLNLTTACINCNLGKGAKSLNNFDVTKKQANILSDERKRLEELAERREQLEMFIEWRKELNELSSYEIELINDVFKSKTKCVYLLNDYAKADIKKLIKKYGFYKVYDATVISVEKYMLINENEDVFKQSFQNAFNKIKGVLIAKDIQEKNPCISKIPYVIAILKNRFGDFESRDIYNIIFKNITSGENIDTFIDFAKRCNSLGNFMYGLRR